MVVPTTSIIKFPLDIETLNIAKDDSKVCVVAVIGKGKWNAFACKATKLNPLLQRDVFKTNSGVHLGLQDQSDVECYYDSDNSVIYLHCCSLHDTYRLATACQRLNQLKTQDFFSLWQKEEYRYVKLILWVFSVSHIIMVSQPGTSFDISYVRLFRTLNDIRLKLQQSVTDELHGMPVSKDWYHSARPCSPRMLFVFESSVDTFDEDESSSSKKQAAGKKIQHVIEDQIYRILRKSRVITNISNNSLFAVPANQEFVYILDDQKEIYDPVELFLDHLKHSTDGNKDTDMGRGRSYMQMRRSSQTTPSAERARTNVHMQKSKKISGFAEFLQQHIELALGRGFDDNFGRNPVPPIFEIPTCLTWFTVAAKLFDFFIGDGIGGKAQPHFNTLKSLLETDIRFSENRCNKVLPLAEAVYQDGSPSHYITSYHLSKLAQAKIKFNQCARGPACEKYLEQLEASCERYWKNGHQLCEETSLTGNHCVNSLHRLPDDPETEANAHLPVMIHSSPLKTKAACNCGRQQVDRDDPFDHKAANFTFYEELEKICCHQLEHITMPIFMPSTTEARAAQSSSAREGTVASSKSAPSKESTLIKPDLVSGMTNLSLALSLGQSGGSDLYGHHSGPADTNSGIDQNDQCDLHDAQHGEDAEHGNDGILEQEESHGSQCNHSDHKGEPPDEEQEEGGVADKEEMSYTAKFSALSSFMRKWPQSPERQHSTTEYLPGMIHSNSPCGLLPKFPSWSLCCLGKSSVYNHTQGLDLPGFLNGSNFLLPWDVTIKPEKEKWPAVGEISSRKSKQKKNMKEFSEVNARIYLGNEYECPRGHRFFCSGPDKIIKVSTTSTVKDNANKLVNLDMPLYCQCPHCRSSKGFMAQLMRLYIVTPEGPLRVTLNPQIQPDPSLDSPVFRAITEPFLELPPAGLWVLRLPLVYVGEDNTVYNRPLATQVGKMQKGVYSYTLVKS